MGAAAGCDVRHTKFAYDFQTTYNDAMSAAKAEFMAVSEGGAPVDLPLPLSPMSAKREVKEISAEIMGLCETVCGPAAPTQPSPPGQGGLSHPFV
jgi:hypothetical protein